jgi:hypothetical protein
LYYSSIKTFHANTPALAKELALVSTTHTTMKKATITFDRMVKESVTVVLPKIEVYQTVKMIKALRLHELQLTPLLNTLEREVLTGAMNYADFGAANVALWQGLTEEQKFVVVYGAIDAK